MHWSLFLLQIRSQVFSFELSKVFKNTYFVKQKWTTAFENHVYLNSVKQFLEFQSDDIIVFAHRMGNADTVKIPSFIRSSCPEVFTPPTVSKKRLWHRCFPVKFVKFLRILFLQMTSGGCFCFMAIEVFVFQVEAFQFSKFHENMGKPDEGKFKKVLSITLKINNS